MQLLACAVLLLAGLAAASHGSSIRLRKGASSVSSSVSLKGKLWRQEMRNFENAQYYATFYVGKQKLEGIFDTGSFELVVVSTRCSQCTRPVYDPQRSSTYKSDGQQIQITYASGPVQCSKSYDTVATGPFTATDFRFWEVLAHDIDVIEVSEFDAIVGIGPDAMKKSQRSLLEAYGVTVFSICLEPKRDQPGWLVWNDVLPAQRSFPMLTVPVVGKMHWAVSMTDVTMVGKGEDGSRVIGCENGCAAIVDSGTSLIAVPTTVLEQVAPFLNELDPECNNLHSLPTLRFRMGDHILTLPPTAYVGAVVGYTPPTVWDWLFFKPSPKLYKQCLPLLIPIDHVTASGPLWIIGMPFFRHYYATFETTPVKKIHFAKAVAGCEAGPLDPVTVLAHGEAEHSTGKVEDGLAIMNSLVSINPHSLRMPRAYVAGADGKVEL